MGGLTLEGRCIRIGAAGRGEDPRRREPPVDAELGVVTLLCLAREWDVAITVAFCLLSAAQDGARAAQVHAAAAAPPPGGGGQSVTIPGRASTYVPRAILAKRGPERRAAGLGALYLSPATLTK